VVRSKASAPADKYPGVDNWENGSLTEGELVWAGAPGQGEFYTTDEVIQSTGNDATKIFEGLQVDKYEGAFRPGMTQYRVTRDTQVARSKALANGNYGPGGFDQIFIPEFEEVLEPVMSLILTNRGGR